MDNTCKKCFITFPVARAELGYTTCLSCGDSVAKQARLGWCVAQEYSKGNYQLITNPETLKETNPRRTT
jgi:ribosomal protein L37AE/L43A